MILVLVSLSTAVFTVSPTLTLPLARVQRCRKTPSVFLVSVTVAQALSRDFSDIAYPDHHAPP